MDEVINLTPLADMLIEILGVVLTALLGYGVMVLKKHLKLKDDDKLDQLLYETIDRGIGFAKYKAKAATRDLTVQTSNQFVEEAAEYVIKGIPHIRKDLGITDQRIKEIIEARIAEEIV